MKTADEIAKLRKDCLDALATANPENVKWLQGCIYGLDFPSKENEDG